MNPVAGDVHVNTPLGNVSVAFMQEASGFVADRVFPNIPVRFKSDRYYTIPRGAFNRVQMLERAESSEAAKLTYEVDSTPTYFAPIYALANPISDERRSNSDDVLNPDMEATELVTLQAMLKRETLWASKYFRSTSGWTTTITGVAAAPGATEAIFWDDDDSSPIQNLRNAITAVLGSTGIKPNTLVLGFEVYQKLIDHPDIVDRVKYGQTPGSPAQVDVPELQALFKIPRIFVMEAIQNTAVENQTDAHSFIGGKNALLCYSTPRPGLRTPTAGYTFSWTGYTGASANGSRIKKYRVEKEASDYVEIEMAFDQKLVSADLGYFWSGIIA